VGIRGIALIALVACGPTNHKHDNGNTDRANECNPEGGHRCNGSTYETCVGATWQPAVDCPTACDETAGCVQCIPGQAFCKDGDVWECDASGNPGGLNTCVGGFCVNACNDAAVSKSYIGCEYWSADLDNAIEVWGGSNGACAQGSPMTLNVCFTMMGGGIYAGQCDPQFGSPPATCPGGTTCQSKLVCASDAQHGPFAVVVSNPQSKPATVTVTGPGGQTITQMVAAGQVAPILMQQGGTIPDQSINGTLKARMGYRIVSDLPVVAYQFNPLDNVNVFSNDASLLIPRTAFDTDYYVMSWPTLDRRPQKDPYYGYLTVIAWQDNTQIQVTPTAATVPSQGQAAIAAGTPTVFTLNAFEVLQLQAAGTGDLTGTHITSPNNMSFGVFGGHEATAFGEATPPDMQHPNGPGFADHLEEMLFPSTTWGKTFAIARSKKRTNEPDYLRIMAQKAGTAVTFAPAPTIVAGNCAALGPGQFCDVKIQVDTEITSTEPVLVGHFLESSTWFSNGGMLIGTGDPSMAIAVPTEQFRKDYTILVPAQYTENYISFAAAATGGVSLDGNPVTLTPFGMHRGARVPVTAGQHKITCADGCGITVYGYSSGVSYMFAGGLDLKPIVVL